ncbi:hypothetical protein RUM43_015021 [Polyplax serrata]|uniref:C2H2-type domain-containing protein n=1 Tax=Polyplax serrata TaxID=468196 RepID=A0AAN8S9H2_POLSC
MEEKTRRLERQNPKESRYFSNKANQHSIEQKASPSKWPPIGKHNQDNSKAERCYENGTFNLTDDANSKKPIPPRRFISSILGGDVPYGSRGHVLTRAERKEYLPLVEETGKTDFQTQKNKEDVPLGVVKHEKGLEKEEEDEMSKMTPALRCQQVSVIQRTPQAKLSPIKTEKVDVDKEPMETDSIPEQEAPIDYHVPKKLSPPLRVIKKYDIKILIPILKKLIIEKYKKLSKNCVGADLKLSEEELLRFLERFHGIQKYFVPGSVLTNSFLDHKRRFIKSGLRKDVAGNAASKLPGLFNNDRLNRRYFEQKNIKELAFLSRKPSGGVFYGTERAQPNYISERDGYLSSAERKRSNSSNFAVETGTCSAFPVRRNGSCGAIMTAAAGHGRTSAAGGGGSGNSGNSSGGGGNGVSYNGGGGGDSSGGLSGCSGGSLGGSLNPGGGGLNPGGPNKGNYGPSSPPTGSLPPFYESLKNGFPGQYLGNSYAVNSLGGPTLPMDCDTGQEILQEMAAYALPASNYDISDSMMVDLATGTVVDPLQFTATLTFASPADHNALLETLSDAADLFLQRLPSDDELNQVTNMDANNLLSSDQDLITQRLGLLNTELKIEPDEILSQKMNNKLDMNAVKLANELAILNENDNKLNCNLNDLLKSGRMSDIRQSYGSTGESLLEDDSLSPMGPDMSPIGSIGSNGEVNVPSPVEPSVNPFPEHCSNNVLGSFPRSYESSRNYPNQPPQFAKSSVFGNNEEYDSESHMQQLQIQVQLQQSNPSINNNTNSNSNSNNNNNNNNNNTNNNSSSNNNNNKSNNNNGTNNSGSAHSMLSPGISFNNGNLESPPMSITSPGGSIDHNGIDGSLSSPGSVNGRRDSAGSCSDPASIVPPGLQVRTATIQSRLGLTGDVHIEFVNGGHGIKNPLANHDHIPGPGRGHLEDKQKSSKIAITKKENGETKFSCRVCSKSFSLQRLLNRHMKCHSDVKRYLCTFCGKGFNDTFDLKRHTRTHTGVRPYKCNLCEKSFTQRCSLESHCLKVHGVQHQYAYKERRTKMYVCEECGHTTNEPEVHYLHLKDRHPYSPALLKFYDKRHFKFTNSNFANMLLQVGNDGDTFQ